MPSETCRPTSTISDTWVDADYQHIDDVVTNPTTGDANFAIADLSDDGNESVWGMETPMSLSSISSVVLHIEHLVEGFAENPEYRIYVGGSWLTLKEATVTESLAYTTVEWTGTWMAADFSDFRVGGTAPDVDGASDEYQLGVLYAVLSYPDASAVVLETEDIALVDVIPVTPQIFVGLLPPTPAVLEVTVQAVTTTADLDVTPIPIDVTIPTVTVISGPFAPVSTIDVTPVAPVTELTVTPDPLLVDVTPIEIVVGDVQLAPVLIDVTISGVEDYPEPLLGRNPVPINVTPVVPVTELTAEPNPVVVHVETPTVVGTPSFPVSPATITLAPVVPSTALSFSDLISPVVVDVTPIVPSPTSGPTPDPLPIDVTIPAVVVVNQVAPDPLVVEITVPAATPDRDLTPDPLTLTFSPEEPQTQLSFSENPLSLEVTVVVPAIVYSTEVSPVVIDLTPVEPVMGSAVLLEVLRAEFISQTPTHTLETAVSPVSLTFSPQTPQFNFAVAPDPVLLEALLVAPVSTLAPATLQPLEVLGSPQPPSLALSLPAEDSVLSEILPVAPNVLYSTAPSPAVLEILPVAPVTVAALSPSPASAVFTVVAPSTVLAAPTLSPTTVEVTATTSRFPRTIGPPDLLAVTDTGLYDDDDITLTQTIQLKWTGLPVGATLYLVRNGDLLLGESGTVEVDGTVTLEYTESSWGEVSYAGAIAY